MSRPIDFKTALVPLLILSPEPTQSFLAGLRSIMCCRLFICAVGLTWATTQLCADGPLPNAFRIDGDTNTTLPWFDLIDGEFPPPNSAHAISGELIGIDHLERKFYLRVDRNDSQQRGDWDLPIAAALLPYGSIWYHGAPAALQDVPLGTHLHGLFYLKSPGDDAANPPLGPNRRVTPEWEFNRCFQLEDDFSFYARQQQSWIIDAIDFENRTITTHLQCGEKYLGPAKVFELPSSTLVMHGEGFSDIQGIAVGQAVQFNITWATLYGPGRITQIWLDQASRQLSTAQQLERHRLHIRERGLAGWVDAVDDRSQIVTITFFGGVDPSLFDELTGINAEPQGWPFSASEDDPLAPKGGIAVARESLMTYDPVNDRKGGNILNIDRVPAEPGSSGVRIRVKCGMLLEGFRPRRIVRFYPATWKVIALPREEQFFGRE